ncbi:MAG TPA: hypothetical protein VF893_05785, partial [Candidatus Bathyarchaeia archaeon]
QSNFNAYYGSAIDDSKIDGNIGSEWDDAGKTTGVVIDPQGSADVWTKNDGTNLYIAVRFTADSANPWIAIQLGGNSCMEANTDAALFGNDNYNVDGYVDCYMSGTGGAKADSTQEGRGAINVTASKSVEVELKKSLNSGDAAGKDINWAINETRTMIIIWDSNGRGSSGGTSNHYGNGPVLGTGTVRTLFLNFKSLEQSGTSIFPNVDATLVAVAVVVVIIAVVVITIGLLWLRKRGARRKFEPS